MHIRKVLVTSAVAAAGAAAAVPVAASADTADAYMARHHLKQANCKKVRAVFKGHHTVDPNTWYQTVKTEFQGGGEYETIVYKQDGVSSYDRYRICRYDGYIDIDDSPSSYVHRTIYMNYRCFGGSCQFLFKKTTKWAKGTWLEQDD